VRVWVGVTDWDWFRQLAAEPELDEVNFWQPGGSREFKALRPGELFLFKLHAPRRSIVGGGFFAHSSRLPVSLAWNAFGTKNGATSLPQMRARIERYRRASADSREDYTIGCILLESPFFFSPSDWIPEPPGWHQNIVQGKTYDLEVEPGETLWREVQGRLALRQTISADRRYGEPTLVLPRLGQGSFRIVVTDAYQRQCAVTRSRTLPVLEAAHIRPYSEGGEHCVENGLLLRSDLHTLFDQGYLTVTPNHRLQVSRRIREDFENGQEYYEMRGRGIHLPLNPAYHPDRDLLVWHNESRYRG
jgi:putative restriction endonuclease